LGGLLALPAVPTPSSRPLKTAAGSSLAQTSGMPNAAASGAGGAGAAGATGAAGARAEAAEAAAGCAGRLPIFFALMGRISEAAAAAAALARRRTCCSTACMGTGARDRSANGTLVNNGPRNN
jgi:hypothetical protein